MDTKVSIVIPVYNGSNYLAEAIESALAQTHRNLEVVVVNDGSTDEGATRRVAERYAGRISYFEKPNGGVASALNFGIARMTGEYFSWLSHDDLYLPDKIEAQLACLMAAVQEGGRGVVVYGGCAAFTHDPMQAQALEVPDAGRKYFRHLLLTSGSVHGCTLLIPGGALRTRLFDETKSTTQDYDMWFRLAGAYDFVRLDRALVLVRQHPEQDSVRKRKKARLEKSALYSEFLAQMSEADLNPTDRKVSALVFMRMAASYAKRGMIKAAMAAMKKSMACAQTRGGFERLMVISGFVFVCILGIPYGLLRVRIADFVRSRSGPNVRHLHT